jgi:hypothetical protein
VSPVAPELIFANEPTIRAISAGCASGVIFVFGDDKVSFVF